MTGCGHHAVSSSMKLANIESQIRAWWPTMIALVLHNLISSAMFPHSLTIDIRKLDGIARAYPPHQSWMICTWPILKPLSSSCIQPSSTGVEEGPIYLLYLLYRQQILWQVSSSPSRPFKSHCTEDSDEADWRLWTPSPQQCKGVA